MMQFLILTVGKTKEKFYREGIEHYVEAIGNLAKVEYFETRDARSNPEQEGELLLTALEKRGLLQGGNAKLILLDVRGKALESEAWAKEFSKWRDSGTKTLVFLIGGAFGFSEDFCKKIPQALRFSLSALTFPHELARLVLCEQIYRALHIESGSKYHHG